MVKRIAVFTIILLCAVSGSLAKNTYVKGYFHKDGTYVSPHYRSAPDSKFCNNWSTSGNINPYTGKEGTVSTPPLGHGASTRARTTYSVPSYNLPSYSSPNISSISTWTPSPVHVDGYTETDGTYVQPHYRTSPDSSSLNNWGSEGNINPFTGEEGSREPAYTPKPLYIPSTKAYTAPRTYSHTPLVYRPSKTLEDYDWESRLRWSNKLKQDWGITVNASTTDVLTMMDLDTRHTWATRIRNSWGLSLDPQKTDALTMMDLDIRYRYSYKIKQEYGMRYDPNKYDALTLMDTYSTLSRPGY